MCFSKKYLIPITAVALFIAAGCSKNIDDRLSGKWQLTTVEQAGVVSAVDTVWYNFQSESLFMYQIYCATADTFIHQYGFKTRSDERTVHLELTSSPRPWADFLPVTDWRDNIRTFNVEKITGSRLILSDSDRIYSFSRR